MKHINNFEKFNEGNSSIQYPHFKKIYLEALNDIWGIDKNDIPDREDKRSVDQLVDHIENWVISSTHKDFMIGNTDDAFTLIDNLIQLKDKTAKRGESKRLVSKVKEMHK